MEEQGELLNDSILTGSLAETRPCRPAESIGATAAAALPEPDRAVQDGSVEVSRPRSGQYAWPRRRRESFTSGHGLDSRRKHPC